VPGSNLTAEARHFLEDLRFAVIATINEDGSPHQTVVWYLLRGDDIVMNTARGRVKERNLRRDPRISVTVEDGYRFNTMRGTARLVDEVATAQKDIRHLGARYHGEETADRQVCEQFSKQERVSIYLAADRVTMYGF
jgi:PPOX class probable F420-dependent enzyme